MKAIQEYIFYNTPYWYGYETKESFENNPKEVTDRVNKILSEAEADKLTRGSRTDVREKIIDILDKK